LRFTAATYSNLYLQHGGGNCCSWIRHAFTRSHLVLEGGRTEQERKVMNNVTAPVNILWRGVRGLC